MGFAKAFLLAAILTAICYLAWGFYYGEFIDQYFTAYIDGSFSGGITKPIFYNYGILPGGGQLVAWAYDAIETVNWYGWFRVVLMLVATACFVACLGLFFRLKTIPAAVAFGISVLLLAFWCQHIVWCKLTELAFISGGLGLLGIIASFTDGVSVLLARPVGFRLLCLLLVAISAEMRVEATLLVLAMFGPYGLWLYGKPAAIKGIAKYGLAMVPIVALAYGFYLYGTGSAEKIFLDTRIYTYTLWDFDQDGIPYKLSSAADSVKLECAQNFFICDEEEFSPAFYERIGVLPREKSLVSIGSYFDGFALRVDRAISSWLLYAKLYTNLFWFYGAALVLFVFLALFRGAYKQLFFVFAMQLWFWLLLFGITVFMKIELHLFLPLVTLGIITLLWFPAFIFPPMRIAASNTLLSVSVTVVLLVLSVWKFVLINGMAADSQEGATNVKAFKAELAKPVFDDKIIVFNNLSWLLLHAHLLDPNEFARDSRFLSFDNGELYMYMEYKQAMDRLLGGHSVRHVVQYLARNKDKVVFVSSHARMDMITRYVETVYGIPFKTKPTLAAGIFRHPVGGVMLPGYADHIDYGFFVLE